MLLSRCPYTAERRTPNRSAICWTVVAGFLELLGERGLSEGELGLAAAPTRPRARAGRDRRGRWPHQFASRFGESGEHPEHGAVLRGGGVDVLLDEVQFDAALAQGAPRVTRCSTEREAGRAG